MIPLDSHPGTVGYHNPEPALVGRVRQLVFEGVPRDKAVSSLAGGLDHADVEAAHAYWEPKMYGMQWDDDTGAPVLMILEDLLRAVPRRSS